MKIRLLLLVAVLGLGLASCDSFKDMASVEKDVEFKVDIPFEPTDEAVSVDLKSGLESYPFGGTAEIDLETDKDVKDYVDGLRSIKASDVVMNYGGLGDDQIINSLSIRIEIVGTSDVAIFGDNNVTSSSIDTHITPFVNYINNWDVTKDHKVKFSVVGTANFKMKNDGSVQAKITIPSTVKYSPL